MRMTASWPPIPHGSKARRLKAHGYRTELAGIAMHRPNDPGYNRPGIYLIDDWR